MKQKFDVSGMTCSACSAHVERAVSKVQGVTSVAVNLLTNSMTVDYDLPATEQNIIGAVKSIGYGAKVQSNVSAPQNNVGIFRLVFSLALVVVLMYFSMGSMFGLPLPDSPLAVALVQFALCVPIWIVNGKYFTSGYYRLFKLNPNMDSLIALGSSASGLYGIVLTVLIAVNTAKGNCDIASSYGKMLYFDSSATILALVDLGKYFEGLSKVRTGNALTKLKKLAPSVATVLRDGKQTQVDISQIAIGDVVVVKAGSQVPCDGKIVEGSCFVDESAVTGESLPCEKSLGDNVIGGTLSVGGYALVQVATLGNDSVLAKIISLVEQAGASKAPIQRLADKIAFVFVPTVMAISLVTFIVWIAISGSFATAINYAVCVLVISCPCALGLATPVAIMVATGKGAQLGILLKDGATLENLCKVSCVVWDKTGTVTEGKPKVVSVYCNCDQRQFVSVVASAENQSEHPLGKAVVDYAVQNGFDVDIPVSQLQTKQGLGLVAQVDGETWAIGNAKLMNELHVDLQEQRDVLDGYYNKALTVLIVAKNGNFVGIIGVGDTVKQTSVTAINNLKQMGIKNVLLTGDNVKSAQNVCNSVGFDDFVAEVLPNQKAEKIQNLMKNDFVAMVGDGINDAPALACANVGFAVANGTDIALDTADVLLVNSNPSDVPCAISLSAKTNKIIRQNLFWAFAYNSLAIPVSAGVFAFVGIVLNPMLASLCMSLSSIFVVTNALRINNFKMQGNGNNLRSNVSCDNLPSKQENNTKSTTVLLSANEGVTMKFNVEGMMCAHCVKHVTDAISNLQGVTSVDVSLQENSATVTGNVTAQQVIAAVTNAGYSAKEII